MIVQEPAVELHESCKELAWDSGKIRDLQNLLITEYNQYQKDHKDLQVVGLAAPQVGQNVKAFYAFGEIFINPGITKRSDANITVKEGCCSLPETETYDIVRSNMVTLRWFSKARQLKTATFYGSQAAVVQHEVDHLRGITIKDRVKQTLAKPSIIRK